MITAVEGWTIFIQGLHEEVREEDVKDKFADCGDIIEFHMPLARATGYVRVRFSAYLVNFTSIEGPYTDFCTFSHTSHLRACSAADHHLTYPIC